ncbi:MAG: hypothetical protein U1D65_17535 [Pseudomonas sp.]|nr:hypothetical protein [Pseudomonas sp.]MDZ4193795.1 hypothetical protein [Pseudomonas sp.]
MFKRPEDEEDIDAYLRDMAEEEKAVTDRLRALIAQKKAEALEGTDSARTRGHATRVLRPRMAELRSMMLLGLSIKEMLDLLEQAGVLVSYHSLRTFLKKHLAAEYRECMAIGSSKGINPDIGQEPDAQLKTQPATQTPAAADHAKPTAPAKSIRKLKEKADAIDYDKFRE